MAVDWESEELSEDEEGQLEVIRALPPSACDTAEVLSSSSLRESGFLDPILEGKAFSVSCQGFCLSPCAGLTLCFV